MPVAPTYPGVYIEEIPSGVRTITGVATSITAFIGRALKGPVDKATRIQSFADYERAFGGLWNESAMSYAVQHFFLHGGRDAIIVRVANGANNATIGLGEDAAALNLEASSAGEWGNALRAAVHHDIAPTAPSDAFNLSVQLLDESGSPAQTEVHRNLTFTAGTPRYVGTVLESESGLVRLAGSAPTTRPATTTGNGPPSESGHWVNATADSGDDGSAIGASQISGAGLEAGRKGLWALEEVDLFNLLCIPPFTRQAGGDVTDAVWTAAAAYCKEQRAFLVVDSPSSWSDTAAADSGVDTLRGAVGDARDHAAAYFPRLKMPDPLQENRTAEFAPSGAVAGIMSRTDASRGVWKAPAGIEATFSGVRELTFKLNDAANGVLNPKGLNCLRSFPVFGKVVWGARTLDGADTLASEWKYVPVRRLALFLEESLYRGTQWAVFEPNDEPLWAELRLNIGAFMQNLFRQGAFQGQAARDAYFVKVDSETTTQNDINLGIVNIVVGFAPLKPAEFVIIKIQQMAGQIEA